MRELQDAVLSAAVERDPGDDHGDLLPVHVHLQQVRLHRGRRAHEDILLREGRHRSDHQFTLNVLFRFS